MSARTLDTKDSNTFGNGSGSGMYFGGRGQRELLCSAKPALFCRAKAVDIASCCDARHSRPCSPESQERGNGNAASARLIATSMTGIAFHSFGIVTIFEP